MESLTKGLRKRKSTLKPIQNIKTNTISDHEDGAYMIASHEEQPLSPSSRLFHEPNFNIYIIAILGSKTPINPRVVYDNLPQSLLKHPRFSSLQVIDEKNGGIMKWVPTSVNLDKHIIIPKMPQTIDSPDKFLDDYLYNLSKTTIESSQPMWDLHLLNLKTSHAEAIGIFRIHHSLGDGTSLMSLLLACTRQTSNPDALPTIPTNNNNNNNSISGWFSSLRSSIGGAWWQRCFMTLTMLFWLVWNTLVDVGYIIATGLFLKDSDTPIKALAGVEHNPKRFVYRTVSLDDMKLIKNAMNMTINDVAVAVTQAGLSHYLNRRYGEAKKGEGAAEKKNNLPKKKIRLRSTLLVNIRPSSGIQELADMMEKNSEAKWGNWIGYVVLPLTVGIRDDPLDYVREAKATIDRKKHSLEALFSFVLAGLLLKLFGVKTATTISHMAIARTTLAFSNVVGPREEIGFYGHHMEFLAPSCYGHPHGLMINFQSYMNKMTMVLSVDENTIPDPHKLLDDLEASLKLIKEAVCANGLACRGGNV